MYKKDIASFDKMMQEFRKLSGFKGNWILDVLEDKEAKKIASLKRFMTMCCNRTTDFVKCKYCEFRFHCYTEVIKKNANNNKQQKRKTAKEKVPNFKPYRKGIVGRIK